MNLEESRAEKLVPWSEYERYIGKEDNFFNPQEEEFDQDVTGTLTPEQQQKRQKAWKKRHYKSDLFINKRLVDLERHLKRINIAGIKKLTTKETSDAITYRNAA